MDYYKVLGLTTSASTDDIKHAYRKLAMKHHPDRGGNEDEFKKIKEAYEKLTDPVNNQSDPNSFGSFQDLHEMFNMGRRAGGRNWGFNTGWAEELRNTDVTVSVPCSLEEAHTGFTKRVEFTLPDGTAKSMMVTFPSGCTSDVKMRYAGQGGQITNAMPPADLYVKLNIASHPIWRMTGQDLFATLQINVWQAMFGATVKLTDISGTEIEITVPPGTQSRSQLRLKNKGFNMRNSTTRYNAYLEVVVIIPSLTDQDLNKTFIDLKEKL